MASSKQPIKRNSWLVYGIFGALTIMLLAVGIGFGRAVFTPQGQAAAQPPVAAQRSGGAVVNPPIQVRDIPLTNQLNSTMSLKDFRGRTVVLFFGYTHCPDVCPTTLADYAQIKKDLGAEADKVRFVFVSIDGARDTPEVVKQFLNQFDSSFIGLMGDEATICDMAAEYGSYFKIPEHHDANDPSHKEDLQSDNYFVEHTSPSYVIDPKGMLRMVYFYGTPNETLAKGILQISREGT